MAPSSAAPRLPRARGAEDELRVIDWKRIAASAELGALLAAKRRFIVPAAVFFIVYYFALPVLVGYAPRFMAQKVWGPLNLAYLFALSQFFMAWLIAGLYLRAASRFDRMAQSVLAGMNRPDRGD